MDYWDEPKSPTTSDRYQLTIDLDWLDGEAILSAVWSTDGDFTISDEIIDTNKVSALFTDGSVGYYCVNVEVTTTTRIKTFCGKLQIRDCC